MLKILVPTDYSECSLAALKHAACLARETGATLLILHVVLPDSPYVALETPQDADPLREKFLLALQAILNEKRPLKHEERRLEGIPAKVILSVAELEEADLIIMGTSGRTGLSRILLGSVAEDVVRRAPCPVLTLKSRPEDARQQAAEPVIERWSKLEIPPAIAAAADEPTRIATNDNPTLALITRAISERASDVHIDPIGEDFAVRFRTDGHLHHYCRLSGDVGRTLETQIKVMANLNIADPFHAKEGRLQLPESMRDFEVRVTAVPVLDGEAVSLRVLDRHRLVRPIEDLGLSPDCQARIQQILQHGEGLVLVTGPTGSGKTTTLYSMLHVLDNGSKNIVSIEDPVEYNIPTFRQLPVDPRHGTTMNVGLRTLLRLDPDVVFVGEIRDTEAAETAMRAASSGKHVFSSLHTRDVASTVTALRDLRIDNRSLAGNLIGIVSQRLIRRLCQECSRTAAITDEEATVFRNAGLNVPTELRHAMGCKRCGQTGYYDRIGIFEVVAFANEIIQAIEEGQPEDRIRDAIRSQGINNLEIEALQRVAEGMTSLEEVHAMRWNPAALPGTQV